MHVLRPSLKRCIVVLGFTLLAGCGEEVDQKAPSVETLERALVPPSGWLGLDIGTSGGVTDSSGGTLTMTSSGADISGTADEFGFVYKSLSGDGEILARVVSQGTSTSDAWAKTGVMIRESLAAGSRHAMMALTPGNGARFKYRDVTDGVSPTSTAGPMVTAPYWVKLVRSGSTFTGYVSQNGVIWTEVASATIPMSATTIYYGMANTPHSTGSITSSFSGFRVVPTAASYPGDKGGGEIGAPPAGYPKLAYAASPLSSDTTFAGFLSRAGMTKKFGESEVQPEPEIVTMNGRRAIRIWAATQTRGSNNGLFIHGFPNSGLTGVPGGPHNSFGRVKILWPTGYSFYPVGPSGDNHADYSGTKAAGFWGGNIPATGDDFDNDGWALTIWTGKWSNNYVALGQDLNYPRSGTYATPAIWYHPDTGAVWKIEDHQGQWVQLEWEHRIETTAGGMGTLRFWINGVKGIDKQVRYFSAEDFSANNNQGARAGLKGIYLRNFWGGSGRAPTKTPIYYADIEVWTP